MIKYIDDFRAADLIARVAAAIKSNNPGGPVNLMEVCGGHTITIHKFNLSGFLPENINLLSGPGCPVCVTSNEFIDKALIISKIPDVIITTFGDLVRVPGSHSSLLQAQAEGADIRICYSPADALTIAADNSHKQIVFLGIGFETTAPLIAAAILNAEKQSLTNFSVLSALKTMPPVMRALLQSGELALDGFICPGHVSAITGIHIYEFIVQEYGIPCVVTGFEPLDLMTAILFLIEMINAKRPAVVNQYNRVVKPEGNQKAMEVLRKVFEPCDAVWRGLGNIPDSGLKPKPEYASYDADLRFSVSVAPSKENPACLCGVVLRGISKPSDCPLFAKVCTPANPQGACMVSAEGACATYYKYGKKHD